METIKAQFSVSDYDGEILLQKRIKARLCPGEKPRVIEIITKEEKGYFEYVLIDVKELKKLLK